MESQASNRKRNPSLSEPAGPAIRDSAVAPALLASCLSLKVSRVEGHHPSGFAITAVGDTTSAGEECATVIAWHDVSDVVEIVASFVPGIPNLCAFRGVSLRCAAAVRRCVSNVCLTALLPPHVWPSDANNAFGAPATLSYPSATVLGCSKSHRVPQFVGSDTPADQWDSVAIRVVFTTAVMLSPVGAPDALAMVAAKDDPATAAAFEPDFSVAPCAGEDDPCDDCRHMLLVMRVQLRTNGAHRLRAWLNVDPGTAEPFASTLRGLACPGAVPRDVVLRIPSVFTALKTLHLHVQLVLPYGPGNEASVDAASERSDSCGS
jgi:hypothetical protein